jgi:hypothetical protein
MSLRHVFAADGEPAVLDDMPPNVRAFAVLLEHANRQRDAGLPLPCLCAECDAIRRCVRAEKTADGQLAIYFTPPPEAQP